MDFSCLLSVYINERPEWLEQSLTSIFSQQVSPQQVVIVEDGPLTESLTKVIDTFEAKFPDRISRFKLPANVGLGAALSFGLSHCTYELVARMDADDLVATGRFAKQIEFLNQHPDIAILGGCAEDINADGNAIGIRKVPIKNSDIHQLMWTCPLIHPSVMFRKSVIEAVGSYSSLLKRRQDYDLWFRCAAAGVKFANLDQVLIQYRITDQTYARNSVKVAWNQAVIGFKGCRALSLGVKAHLGVFYPVIKAVLPLKLRKGLEGIIKKFDPRGKH